MASLCDKTLKQLGVDDDDDDDNVDDNDNVHVNVITNF